MLDGGLHKKAAYGNHVFMIGWLSNKKSGRKHVGEWAIDCSIRVSDLLGIGSGICDLASLQK
jgi:hypothetical protein